MWKCIGFLLFFGQWIVITAESSENPGVPSQRNGECCPCPEARSDDLTPSPSTHMIDSCPCKARSADSDAAASIFSPGSSVGQPISRQAQLKEVKPLLEPEVGLVSSVLETLHEATEEEYQEALAKDAKNAKQDEINNPVTIVVNPEYRDSDVEAEASQSHPVKCTFPLEGQESVLRHNSVYYPYTGLSNAANKPILGKSHDTNEESSIYYRSSNIPRNVELSDNYKNPLHNILKTPIFNQNSFVAHSDNLLRFAPLYDTKYLPLTSLLPRGRNNLLGLHNPFQVQSISKQEVATAISKEILDDDIGSRETLRNSPENGLDTELAENKYAKNCVVDDLSKNNNENPVKTTIWNILPNSGDRKIQTKSSEVPDYIDEPNRYADEKNLHSDSNQSDTFRDTDDVVEEYGNIYDTQVSPSNNNNDFLFHKSFDSVSQQRSSQQAKNISLVKHDKLKSTLDNLLKINSGREILANDYSNANPSTLEPQTHASNYKETMKSMNHKFLGLKDTNTENEDKLFSLQEIKLKSNDDKYDDSVGNADEKSSENIDACLVYGMKEKKNVYNGDNEMKMSASDSSSTRFGISQIPRSALKTSQKKNFNLPAPANALEDINLDIFQYQPISLDQDSRRNTQALPRLNMQSYKTKLPIPKSVDLKPVKLQKAFRKGNGLLGAVLTIEPHAADTTNKQKSSQSKSSHNIEPTLEMFPSFNEIKSFLEHGAQNLLKLPHLSKNNGKKLTMPFQNIQESKGNLKVYTEDALNDVHQSLSNILPNIHEGDRNTLGSSLLNPNELVESISRNDLKINERIHAINERLKSVFDQSRPAYIQPIHSLYKIRPKTIKTEIKQLTPAYIPPSRLFSNKDSNILHGNLNPKGPMPTLKLSENLLTKLPLGKIDRQLSENYKLGKTLNSRPILPKNIKPTGNKSATSFVTPKKSTSLESLINKKSVLPTLENSLENPSRFRSALTQNLKSKFNKEQTILPSEIIYKKVPMEGTTRQSLPKENQDIELEGRGLIKDRPTQSLAKKLLLPNIAESNILSKIKEALNKDIRRSNNENKPDIMSSASSNLMPAELRKEKMTFDCKMVCNSA